MLNSKEFLDGIQNRNHIGQSIKTNPILNAAASDEAMRSEFSDDNLLCLE